MDEEQKSNIEEAIEEFPKEVGDFVFGAGMESVKEKITRAVQNNKEYSVSVMNELFLFLCGLTPDQKLVQTIDALPVSEESKTEVKRIIQQDVIDALILLTEVHEELDLGTTTEAPPKGGSSSSGVALDTLRARLTSAGTIAPIARTAGDISKGGSITSTAPQADPYREHIEK